MGEVVDDEGDGGDGGDGGDERDGEDVGTAGKASKPPIFNPSLLRRFITTRISSETSAVRPSFATIGTSLKRKASPNTP